MLNQQVSYTKFVQIGDHYIQYRHNSFVENFGAFYQVHYALQRPHHLLQGILVRMFMGRELIFPNVTPLDFFSWGHMKSLLYER